MTHDEIILALVKRVRELGFRLELYSDGSVHVHHAEHGGASFDSAADALEDLTEPE